MADGAYERRAGREAELKRFERILRETALSRADAPEQKTAVGKKGETSGGMKIFDR